MLFRNSIITAAFSLILFTWVLSFSPLVTAQSGSPTPPPAPAKPDTAPAASAHPSSPQRRQQSSYRVHTLDDRVKALAKALDLNETQQTGVKAVLERQQLQARQIQVDPTLSGEERIGRFRALQEDTVLRIRALLNDEQKVKYNPLSRLAPDATPSDYVNQWMRYHERADQPSPPPKK